MTTRSVVHASFTITRNWPHPSGKVFNAFADQKAKDKWFGGGSDWISLTREFDFRVGGKEHAAGRWKTGMISTFDCIYHDIVDNERIVYSYTMHLDDRKISISQACIEFKAEGPPDNPNGTKLVLTEYGDFLDGYDDAGSREHGTNFLMDALGKIFGLRMRTMQLSELARSYYRAYEQHDPDTVARNLAPGFTFTSPFDDHIGREEYFRRCWPATPMHHSFQFVSLMESGNQVLVVYDAELRAPNAVHVTGRFRNAELMIFEDGKLKSVEVFFGDPPNGLTRRQFAEQCGAG